MRRTVPGARQDGTIDRRHQRKGSLDRVVWVPRPQGVVRLLIATLMSAIVLLGFGPMASAAVPRTPPVGGYHGFTHPQVVTIRGYSGSAMEPFVSTDGRYLLFNTSNVSPNIPTLQFAIRVSTTVFRYRGAIRGANDPGYLSATPSMDRNGDLYFVSTRTYSTTLASIYRGTFTNGHLRRVRLVAGIAAPALRSIDFDADVSPDGSTLYVSTGRFDGGPPTSASVTMFDVIGATTIADPNADRILRAVNRPGRLTYAASISPNGLELFFTQAAPNGGVPAIYRAVRSGPGRAFGHVQRIAAITGYAEAPSISTDGTTLYYHRLVGGTFQIWEVTRPRP
jgi:hypothetical protein